MPWGQAGSLTVSFASTHVREPPAALISDPARTRTPVVVTVAVSVIVIAVPAPKPYGRGVAIGLRQHSYAVLRASTLEAQRASRAETSGADGQAAAGEPHLGAIHATFIGESRSDVVKGAKDAQHLFSESTEPLLAVWRMQETEKKGSCCAEDPREARRCGA